MSMNVFSRIFNRKKTNTSSKLALYLNADFKQSIEVEDQEVGSYISENQEEKQYIFLLIKDKKDNIILKRKLNHHQKFSEVLSEVDPLYNGFLILGYDNIRKNSLKLNILKSGIQTQSNQSIRSGILYKYSDTQQKFDQCHFKLLPNYLMYYKVKNKDDISFIPLQNASIVHLDEGQMIFGIHQKFKTIKIKAMSKEDMKGWLISIDDAIKIKQCERGLAKCAQRVSNQQSSKIQRYKQQSKNLMEQEKVLVTDPKGRKALQTYFQKQSEENIQNDVKLLSIYCKYVYYCELLRQQSKESRELIKDINQDMHQLSQYLQQSLKLQYPIKQNIQNTQLYRLLDSVATYLGKKYHEKLKNGRYLQQAILQSAVNQHKEQNKLHLMSILGTMEKKI